MAPTASATPFPARLQALRAAADPTRLAILDRLYRSTERCHRCLERDLGVPANRMSFHLRVLREAGLVDSDRAGRRVCYRLADGAVEVLHAALPGPSCPGPDPDAEPVGRGPGACAADVHESV